MEFGVESAHTGRRSESISVPTRVPAKCLPAADISFMVGALVGAGFSLGKIGGILPVNTYNGRFAFAYEIPG